jgi:hypothetical protein
MRRHKRFFAWGAENSMIGPAGIAEFATLVLLDAQFQMSSLPLLHIVQTRPMQARHYLWHS